MAMPRDVTWPMQFFAYNLSGKHFTPTSFGVIRNQRSKIRRSNITSTAGCPFRKISKFECRVIKHARTLQQSSIFEAKETTLKAEDYGSRQMMIRFKELRPSVLNHSTLEFRDFSKRAPGSWTYVRSTYFWTLIPNHPTWRRGKMLPWQVIGKKTASVTWHHVAWPFKGKKSNFSLVLGFWLWFGLWLWLGLWLGSE